MQIIDMAVHCIFQQFMCVLAVFYNSKFRLTMKAYASIHYGNQGRQGVRRPAVLVVIVAVCGVMTRCREARMFPF